MKKKIALTIGGSDSGGGAGIQADLKTFMTLDVYGCSAITCVTAQNTIGVTKVDPLSKESVNAQINTVLDDFDISALKTGMLYNNSIIRETGKIINQFKGAKIIDPVMVSRAGSLLIEKEAIQSYKDILLPIAEIITPNIYEAMTITNMNINSRLEIEKAAIHLLRMGPKAVLIKGGGLNELQGKDFYLDNAGKNTWIEHEHIKTKNTHGTGCTLNAAITANRAKNIPMYQAVELSKKYIEDSLKKNLEIGNGSGPLWHGQ